MWSWDDFFLISEKNCNYFFEMLNWNKHHIKEHKKVSINLLHLISLLIFFIDVNDILILINWCTLILNVEVLSLIESFIELKRGVRDLVLPIRFLSITLGMISKRAGWRFAYLSNFQIVRYNSAEELVLYIK